MKSKSTPSARSSSSPVKKTLRVLKSRTAGIVAAVVGTAVTTAVGAAIAKKTRASGRKKPAGRKVTATRAAHSPRRASRTKGKGRARSTATASA